MLNRKIVSVLSIILINGWLFINSDNLGGDNFLLITYWIETIIIVLFTALKMSKAEKMGKTIMGAPQDKKGKIKFFLLNSSKIIVVSFFMIMHYIFFNGTENFQIPPDLNIEFFRNVLFVSLGFLSSHYLSYRINFIGNREYEKISIHDLYKIPRERILSIYFATGILAIISSPARIIVLFKTIIDIHSHLKERTRGESIEAIFNSPNKVSF